MLRTLAIANYRSIRSLAIELTGITVVVGPNGVGKSNLYRALRLLADIAQGKLASSLANEGGLASTMWAGPEVITRGMRRGDQPVQGTVRRNEVALKLGFSSDTLGYAVDLGLPQPSRSLFALDPEIKQEVVFTGDYPKRSGLLADRRGPAVRTAGESGALEIVHTNLAPFDSMLTHVADPRRCPELLEMRERLRGFRFYDQIRTDIEAPARARRMGTRTPVLASDAGDLAAAAQTIMEIGDGETLQAMLAEAFDGAQLAIGAQDGILELMLQQRGLLRPLRLGELSDGTIRFIATCVALLTPRPPEFLVLNEPEASLHPSLVSVLGDLIGQASQRTQILVISHSVELAERLARHDGASLVRFEKILGETVVDDAHTAAWSWPKR